MSSSQGASGYIGGSIAAHLIEHRHAVRGLVRGAEKVEALARLGVEPVHGDLEDLALLEREAASADAWLNAASSDHRASIAALDRCARRHRQGPASTPAAPA
jgi:uncharacterized protein YbjT (DUF2867 family)